MQPRQLLLGEHIPSRDPTSTPSPSTVKAGIGIVATSGGPPRVVVVFSLETTGWPEGLDPSWARFSGSARVVGGRSLPRRVWEAECSRTGPCTLPTPKLR
jgi:hypothetical protein